MSLASASLAPRPLEPTRGRTGGAAHVLSLALVVGVPDAPRYP